MPSDTKLRSSTNAAKKASQTKELETDLEMILKRLNQLEEDNKRLAAENTEFRKRLNTIENRDWASEKRMTETIKNAVQEQKESYVEMLKKNIQTEPRKVIMKEVSDIQERRLNMVFRGIKENSTTDTEEEKKYDREQVLKVVALAGLDEAEFGRKIISWRRLGKRNHDQGNPNRWRPILVKTASTEMREKAIRSNAKLRTYNQRNGDTEGATRFRIDADLTKTQKENLDLMWEEARRKNKEEAKNGVRYFIIGQENPQMRYRTINEETQN